MTEEELEREKRAQEERMTVHKGEFIIHKKGEHIPTTKELLEQRRKELEALKQQLEQEKKNQSEGPKGMRL